MDTERPITARERRFADAYLELWRADLAAEQAGYKNFKRAGYKLLHREQVQEYIRQKMEEMGLPAREVVARLAQQARANVGDFIAVINTVDEKTGESIRKIEVDWDAIKERGYLVKRLAFTSKGFPVLELHDAQKALELIGKTHGIFRDITEVTGAGGGPLTWAEFIKQEKTNDAESGASSE